MLAKAPNRKRAVEYLALSGAAAIWIIERDGVCSISTGQWLRGGGIRSTWWTAEQDGARIASAARRVAGPAAAVTRSAAVLKATLTPDDIAIGRASAAVSRLDAMIEAMRRVYFVPLVQFAQVSARFRNSMRDTNAAVLRRWHGARASWDSGLRWRGSRPR